MIFPIGSVEKRHSSQDLNSYKLIEESFNESKVRLFEKMEAFPRFASKRSVARFLCKSEIFKKIIDVNGAVIECGVFNGAGLFTWGHLTNIYEPTNYNRKIIGFDTFEGFPGVTENDANNDKKFKAGDLKGDSYDAISLSVEKYNQERHLRHIPNIELVKGDFNIEAPNFLKKNPHMLISLLYLDFDLYEPTKKALEIFMPRMCKGAIICFDELNCSNFPGETLAMLEMLDMRSSKINRFHIDPWISYIQL